jgi:cyclopropane fatty-acyl-phospholipid synthase-like methyltransferase
VKKDIRYLPSPPTVVEAMLDLAGFGPKDVLYDLGSGDGRLVLAAARRGGRGVGIEIDSSLVTRSRLSAETQGLTGLAEFRQESFFAANLGDATVVTAYLFHSVNMALRPKLLAELRPGTRLVSHSFDMEDWEPDRRVTVDAKWLFLWTVPEGVHPFHRSTRGQAGTP